MTNKKILYIGCHGYLEYDDIKILSHAGFSVFSTGGWSDPLQPASAVRPPIPSARQVPGALELWNRDKLTPQSCVQSAAFLELFDAILVVHDHSIIELIPADIKKPIIFRTIGQSSPPLERWMSQHRDRIKIVRYSPNESNIPGYAGADALIRFGKFEEDFPSWSGHEKTVLSFYQQALRRLAHANYEFYELATAPFPRVLYGNGNPPSEFSRPTATYDDMQRYYSAHRVYYSLGTYPASYTLNFMEAMMVGIPLVTLGRSVAAHSSINDPHYPSLYEVPDILEGAPAPLAAESVEDAHKVIRTLLDDDAIASATSTWQREKARQLFSGHAVAEDWRRFLTGLHT